MADPSKVMIKANLRMTFIAIRKESKMPDASDKIRGFIEKVIRFVPGYTGYADKESRRNTDKLLREHLARRMDEAKSSFDGFVSSLSQKPGSLEMMNPAGSASKIFEKVIDRLRFADYGYAGFFSEQKVQEAELEVLHQFDLGLAADIEDIKAKVSSLKPDQASLDALLAALRAFDAKLNARQEAITESKAQ
jgi:hypothetical protein